MASGFGRIEERAPSDIALPAPTDRAVVAELFTSEGCSSCPPADELLRRLAREQFVPGVRVLALGEHVDYWDRLGWRDPFSSPGFSNRQSEYEARVFHKGSVYTPQLVIDGRLEEVGSDVTAVRRAIARAAQEAKATVGVTARPGDAGRLRVEVQVTLEYHLSVCANCGKYLTSYEETVKLGKKAFEDESAPLPAEVPEDLVAAILAARRS